MQEIEKEEIEVLIEEKSMIKLIISTFLFLFLIFYTIYHIYSGNYSIKNYINKKSLINKKNITLLNSEKEVNFLKNKVNNLQDSNIDSDLLDEEIRKNTSYAKKNEIIIYSDDLEKNNPSMINN